MRKKLVITFITAVMALIVLVFSATSVVVALTNQSSSTPVKVVYTAKNVSGQVACTQFSASSQQPFATGESGVVSFASNTYQTSFNLQPEQKELTQSDSYVVYELAFSNNSATSNYLVNASYSGEDYQNLEFYAFNSGEQQSFQYNSAKERAVKTSASMLIPMFILQNGEQNHYVYIVISLKSPATSATVSGFLNCVVANMLNN